MVKIAKKLEDEGADLLNITARIFDSPFYPVVPFMNQPRGVYSEYSKIIKRSASKIPICVVGRINTPEIAEEILQDNRADMVAMGRAVISDPYFPQKVQEGRRVEMVVCPACNACLNQILIEEKISCSINANLLGRYEDIQKVKTRSKVLIVGAGPAGLEAAIVGRLRGHDILVIDKQNKIGGNLHLASVAPMKQETENFINRYNHLTQKFSINIRLDTPYSQEILDEFKPDVVILATGSKPSIPKIKGLTEDNYKLYTDILTGNLPEGERITIFGGGMIGLEVANILSSKNRKLQFLKRTQYLVLIYILLLALKLFKELRMMRI